jgi:hypothetical protein
MTDIYSVYFLIGLSALFSILTFVFRHSMLCFITGIGWLVLGVYNFTRVYSGDPDSGVMTWAFGWLCLLLALVFWTAPLWLLKMKVEDKPIEKKDYYTEMEERANEIRRLRPQRKKPSDWGI